VSYTLGEIAAIVDGTLHGDSARLIDAALPLTEASARDITFVQSQKQAKSLEALQAGAYFVTSDLLEFILGRNGNCIVVNDPLAAMQAITKRLQSPLLPMTPHIDPRAAIDPTAEIGPHVLIGPFAVVGAYTKIGAHSVIHPHVVVGQRCEIGRHVEIHPHAVLYARTTLRDRSVIHAGAIIGCDGFGYRLVDGKHSKIEQMGGVEIASDVEVGACTTIDRATFGTTKIDEGTKIDNLVMVGHNCKVGKHNIFVSQVGVSGSCETGDYVILAGQVGIADHVKIGTGAVLMAKSGVPRDVPEKVIYGGSPARPDWQFKREQLSLAKLSDIRRELAEVRRVLGLAANKENNKDSANPPQTKVA